MISAIEGFVDELLTWQLPEDLYFHDKQHTVHVVAAVHTLGEHSGLTDADRAALLAAAWFHDTGYYYTYEGHEEHSAMLAERFLRHHGCNAALQQQVQQLILATRVPQQPADRLQEIICDADLFHLSRPDYPDYAGRLRREWAVKLQKVFSDEEWRTLNIRFLENHAYFNTYAQQHWGPLKQLNLEKLRQLPAGS